MPPDDPLGRHGPSLENFLRKKPIIPEHRKQPCPYGKNMHLYALLFLSALEVFERTVNIFLSAQFFLHINVKLLLLLLFFIL